jgi:membrane-associated protease RseP (regulator of RpoE activity)
VIRIKSPIPTRKALFDIGIAGPIAGFIVAVIALTAALSASKPLAAGLGPSDLRLGFPEIFFVVQDVLRSLSPGHPASALPLARIYLHPTAIAAWVGMFATALNLLPSSQLDGGHIVYALAPRAHRVISWLTVIALGFMGWRSYTWWFWAALITLMNILTYRQQQAPEYPMLPASRWVLGGVALIMLALTITIAPFQLASK